MRHITKINVFHIISEPGDGTQYDYLINQDGPDDFTIAPAKSTFKFPQRLNYFGVKRILENDKILLEVAKSEDVNPHTLREVYRTVVEIHDGLTYIEQ